MLNQVKFVSLKESKCYGLFLALYCMSKADIKVNTNLLMDTFCVIMLTDKNEPTNGQTFNLQSEISH